MSHNPIPVAKPTEMYHHGDLRRALISAALAEVERTDPGSISVSALAKTLGVSRAAPYQHFSDRDEVLAAVAMEGFKVFAAALRKSVVVPSKRPALARMACAYVSFGLERPGLYSLMFASPILPNASADHDLRLAAQESFRLLMQVLGPSRNPDVRKRLAVRIWIALHGIVMLAKHGLLRDTDSGVEELVEDIIAQLKTTTA